MEYPEYLEFQKFMWQRPGRNNGISGILEFSIIYLKTIVPEKLEFLEYPEFLEFQKFL